MTIWRNLCGGNYYFLKHQMDPGVENTMNEVKDEIESVNSKIDKAKEPVNSDYKEIYSQKGKK